MSQGTKGAAKEDSLGTLHDTLAKKLKALIDGGETQIIAGKEKKIGVSAAVLAVARGFLKDNNIQCDPDLPTRAVGELAKSVAATLEDDEDIPDFSDQH